MNSLRFNPPPEWNVIRTGNRYYLGLSVLIFDLFEILKHKENLKMLEIGSYKGESTFMFAASGIFSEIHCIDPFEGFEQANEDFKENWDTVKAQFDTNTRYFNNIKFYQDYSYNIVDTFPDQYFDFIYIDGSHIYEDVKKDIEMYLPKTKTIIGGHDFHEKWPGVVNAVTEVLGQPNKIYLDESWIRMLNPFRKK